jgi:Heterokaryon incompatibility protein (HET)
MTGLEMPVTAQQGQLYQPLKEYSIRLLSISPGYLADRIECILVSVDKLDEAPPYNALSYVWGTEESRETIVCNGVQKKATANLYEALKHLRPLPSWNYQNAWDEDHRLHSKRNVWRGFAKHHYEDYGKLASTETLVWIDALCINQDDPHEQASQVKLMRSIYKQATTVRIWLGPEDTHLVSEPEIKGWNRRLAARVTPRHHVGNYGDMPVVLSLSLHKR